MNQESKQVIRIRELTEILSAAAQAYYVEDRELMSNLEYDKLYDELVELEEATGFALAGSPTQYVGYQTVSDLAKEEHKRPMLSLAKTKSRDEVRAWLGEYSGILSWKLDGLTIIVTYNEGKLAKALTRGNGEIGEVVTTNARHFIGLPLTIPYDGEVILRGEAVISYSDFEAINAVLPETEEKYKNPRNLCSGSVRQLSNEITAARKVRFFAFGLVRVEGMEFSHRHQQLEFLGRQGFTMVESLAVDFDSVIPRIEWHEEKIKDFDIPTDGLVICYNDISFGESLGTTAKFPRDALAFKWKDEECETTLLDIEWSPSRTGLINPIAVFAPVELEGTTVTRASLHNISILRSLRLGIGDQIMVYKANMIIPQVAANLTESNTAEIPAMCPACGLMAEVRVTNDVSSLYCPNYDCGAKMLKSFSLLTSRDALNIVGLSEATLEKLIGRGFIRTYADIFRLARYRKEIIAMEGFGEKSFDNLVENINVARYTTMPRLIYGLGIANIGITTAKNLCSEYEYDIERLRNTTADQLLRVAGIGPVVAASISEYFNNSKHVAWLDELLAEVRIATPILDEVESDLEGLSFVITGSLQLFVSRSNLEEEIMKRGGKVTSSVSGNTRALINNDASSGSNKSKAARELNIPILTEEEFIEMFPVK
ncbi:MAG: NAD-dependent DNA ligase LigA [Lachnospiraceae bacterium]|jgi:DNA ligase (NAD+)|nr:NAD-dependent DNA ligase LigA [Lachnospiraceae bacterium]